MCRHLAYLGPPVPLASLLVEPEWSLLRQSYAPRMQRHGVVNADGFGVGWYAPAARAEPVLYRRGTPIWSDTSFLSLAGAVSSGAVVASVRSATPPSAVDEASAPPFASGRWLFALNGAVAVGTVRALVSRDRLLALSTGTDTESLFALVLDRLDAGDPPGDALGWVCRALPEARLNLLLGDGVGVWATAWEDTLFTRAGPGVVVASEPFDDGAGWEEVPERSLVSATAESLKVEPL